MARDNGNVFGVASGTVALAFAIGFDDSGYRVNEDVGNVGLRLTVLSGALSLDITVSYRSDIHDSYY